MTAGQMLDVLNAAIASAEAHPTKRLWWRRKRAAILSLRAPIVLGRTGKPDGLDSMDVPVFGYTLAQCREMRDEIIGAIQEEMDAIGVTGT